MLARRLGTDLGSVQIWTLMEFDSPNLRYDLPTY